MLAARAHPRPAPRERAPGSSGGVIEPIPCAVRKEQGTHHGTAAKEKGHPRVSFFFEVC